MPKTVNIQGVGQLNFPDETPDAVLDAAVKKHVAGFQQQRRQEAGKMAAEGMSTGQKMLAGAGRGTENLIKSVLPQTMAQKLGVGTTTQEDRDYSGGLGVPGKVGEIGAEVAATMIPAARGAQAAGKLIPALTSTIPRMSATTGAISGAMAAPENKGIAAAGGAAGGALGGAVLRKAMQRFAAPIPQDPSIQMIGATTGRPLSAGQGADVGQFAGRLGQKVEEKMATVPILGRGVAAARGDPMPVMNPGWWALTGLAAKFMPHTSVPAGAATFAAGTKAGQKALKGDFALQKALADALRQTPGGDTATIGAATGGGDVGGELAEYFANRRR